MKIFLRLFTAFLVFSASAHAAATAPVITTLPDGATLVVLPEPKADGVIFDVVFRVGVGDETAQQGIVALIARAWIGETTGRSAPLLANDIARTGGSVGTDCGADWVEVWSASGSDPYAVEKSAQNLLTNIVSVPAFPPEAIEAARGDQERALLLRDDDLLTSVLDAARSRAFGESPLARTPLGTTESVEAITARQVVPFYRRFFRPNRAVIVVAGKITADEAMRRVTASLGAGDWDVLAPPAPAERISLASPIPSGLRDLRVNRRAPAVCCAASFLAPGLGRVNGASDYAAMLVLDAILRGGKSSRLFLGLRDGDTPAGYEVRTVLDPGRAQSLWTAYVLGDQPVSAVRDRLLSLLTATASGETPITDAELKRAKTYLKARHREERERLKQRAFGAAWSEAMGIGAAFDTDYETHIDTVSLEAVSALAKRVLGGQPVVAYTLPLK